MVIRVVGVEVVVVDLHRGSVDCNDCIGRRF